MKRQQKYPDTDTFHFYNANPKGRITGDCEVRALSMALNLPYNEVIQEMAEIFVETGYAWACNENEEIFLERHGWKKKRQPRKADNTKYTGKEFCREIAKEGKTYFARIGGHHVVAIIDKQVWDIWDCTRKCVGNYWVKE